MAKELPHVSPGQIISSVFINDILDTLKEFEQRIKNLETGTSLPSQQIIDEFDPSAQQEVGRLLKIKGKFDFPPSFNEVTIDGKSIPKFEDGSDDNELLFFIPTSIQVPTGTTRSVIIQIKNSKGQDQRSYLLLPFVPSTVPPPVITSATDVASGNSVLQTNKLAKIVGTNFADNPSQNRITLTIKLVGGDITYPKSGEQLQIDTSQSGRQQIVFTVPNITEIGIGSTTSLIIKIEIGTAMPAIHQAQVIRLP